jgi:hypothetical protein
MEGSLTFKVQSPKENCLASLIPTLLDAIRELHEQTQKRLLISVIAGSFLRVSFGGCRLAGKPHQQLLLSG